ncbi:MAG TPA: hypothetical protein VM052_06945 [Candidatus Limnocylindrales bacterium]|nr:hypothetical protein [Candidatus Limnocylindrales bacterium]
MSDDPGAIALTPETQKWDPLTPEQVAALLRGVDVPWWIAGGWALDLFMGRQTRAHHDVEISVFRSDEAAVRRHLRGWEIAIAADGTLTPLADGEPLPSTAHELWSRERGHDGWQLEILIEERDGDRWVYRRDHRVGVNARDIGRFTNDGIPFIRPDIQLLYKSKASRGVDESDLIAVLPRLDAAQRSTLAAWISAGDATHRWLTRLQ